MAKSIKGVGVRHYVDDCSTYFQSNLKKGDIVYAMPDYESYHDIGNSIALYHNHSMIAHAEAGSRHTIGKLFEKKLEDKGNTTLNDTFESEVVAFRYTGVHKVDDGSFSLSLGKIIDTPPFSLDPKTYKDFDSTAIYYNEAPYIMKEERSLFFLANDIIKDADDIVCRDANSPVTRVLAQELEEYLKTYEPICCISLSKDCRQYLQHIIQCLENVCDVSDDLAEQFEPYLEALNLKTSLLRKGQIQESILNNQVLAVTNEFENGKFFNRFRYNAFKENQDCPDCDEINNHVKRIKNWMIHTIPSGAGQDFEKDNAAFAKALYNINLNYKDLYFIYAHIAILNYCDILYKLWRGNGPFIEYHNSTINHIHQMYVMEDGICKLRKPVFEEPVM